MQTQESRNTARATAEFSTSYEETAISLARFSTEIHIQILLSLPLSSHANCMLVCRLWHDIIVSFRRQDLGPLLCRLPNHLHVRILRYLPVSSDPICMTTTTLWRYLLTRSERLKKARYLHASGRPPCHLLAVGYNRSLNFRVDLKEGENPEISSVRFHGDMVQAFCRRVSAHKPPENIALYNLDLTNHPILDEMLLYYDAQGPQRTQRHKLNESVTVEFQFDFRNAIPLPLDAAVELDSQTYKWLMNVTLKKLCMLVANCIAAQKRKANRYEGHEWVNVKIECRQNLKRYSGIAWRTTVTDGNGRRIR